MVISRIINAAAVAAALLLQACAGSPPDYSPRTAATAQEASLTQYFDQEQPPDRSQLIKAPICSTTVGTPASGWAIDGGEWCVIACDSESVGESRWVDVGGSRCLATPQRQPATLVTVPYTPADLSLDQPAVFSGFSRSFLTDTEWSCKEFKYRVDPESRLGFWEELNGVSLQYRFHRDGRLVIGKDRGGAKPSGSWEVQRGDQVFFNGRPVFTHAIDYGGGRFDDFITSRTKQVCRFVQEADPPA